MEYKILERDAKLGMYSAAKKLRQRQEKLEMLVSKGALIGSPSITLATGSAGSSEASDILIANFEWHVSATVTPPLKAATVVVSYTDAGFQILYGGEE